MLKDYVALLNSTNGSLYVSLNSTTSKPPHQVNRDTQVVFWCFLSLEILVILFGNGMLCWLFFCRRNLRTLPNYFVLSLSVSDFLVGLTIAPCEYCTVVTRTAICPLFCGSVLSFNMLASTINLILIAADRYFSIMRPFSYHEALSKRRAKIIILLGWLTTLLLTLVPFAWAANDSLDFNKKMKINFVFVVVLFSAIILIGIMLGVLYYRIVRTAQSKLKATNETSSNPAGIKVCILVAISFFVCWIPTCVAESLIQSRIHVTKPIMNTVYFFLLINPCLDPIMYAYYRRDFRHELGCWMRRRWNSCRKFYNRVFSRDAYTSRFSSNNNSTVSSSNNRTSPSKQMRDSLETTSLAQSDTKNNLIELPAVAASNETELLQPK